MVRVSDVAIPEEAFDRAEQVLRDTGLMAGSDCYDVGSDVIQAAAPLILAAELDRLADDLGARARRREAVGDGDPCEDECEEVTCHTVAAVATWFRAAGVVRGRAAVLRGDQT